jgi:hypothetical protein
MTNYHRMSPAIRARCIQDDREYAAALRATEQQRVRRAEEVEGRRIRMAMEAAEERGEVFSVAEFLRSGGAIVAHTASEGAAYHWAMAEAQEARQAARSAPVLTEDDIRDRHAAMIAADPRMGRTRAEAVAYYSALGDLQEIDAARTAAQQKATAEQSAREKLDAKYAARAQEKHLHDVARLEAQRVVGRNLLARERERVLLQQLESGEIYEEQYLDAHRGVPA